MVTAYLGLRYFKTVPSNSTAKTIMTCPNTSFILSSQNYMFRPISGHLHVIDKYVEEDEKESPKQRPVEANSTGGLGSLRAIAPSDDDDDDDDIEEDMYQ